MPDGGADTKHLRYTAGPPRSRQSRLMPTEEKSCALLPLSGDLRRWRTIARVRCPNKSASGNQYSRTIDHSQSRMIFLLVDSRRRWLNQVEGRCSVTRVNHFFQFYN